MMRLFLTSLLLLCCLPLFCQTQAIPKTYSYFSEKEQWRLTIFDTGSFEISIRHHSESYNLVLEGNYILTDSTIRLVFNPSPDLNFMIKDTASYGPNIKELIKGNAFKRVNDYIIPKIAAGYNRSQAVAGTGIYGSFFQQVELFMGGTKIQFEHKNRYILTESFCTGKFIEKGWYTLSGNMVRLKPRKKARVCSTHLMDNAVVFATEHFLISRKVQPGMEPDRFAKEEVFLYYHRL